MATIIEQENRGPGSQSSSSSSSSSGSSSGSRSSSSSSRRLEDEARVPLKLSDGLSGTDESSALVSVVVNSFDDVDPPVPMRTHARPGLRGGGNAVSGGGGGNSSDDELQDELLPHREKSRHSDILQDAESRISQAMDRHISSVAEVAAREELERRNRRAGLRIFCVTAVTIVVVVAVIIVAFAVWPTGASRRHLLLLLTPSQE